MSLLKFNKLDIKIELDSHKEYRAHKRCIRYKKVDSKKECIEHKYESLKEHIDLVYKYFLHLVEKNRLEDHLDKFFDESVTLLDDVSKETEFANFVKKLFIKAIYWHDMGKMNPNFQADKEKMDNSEFEKIELSEGNNHSPLGAYLFINHSLQELYGKNWDEDEIEILETVVYIFGYLISKHHGIIYAYDDIDFKDDLEQFLKLFNIEKCFTKIHKNENRSFLSIWDYIDKNKDTLFLISKSLFSLLILSDYYATAQFMNYGNQEELVYNDLGLIDDKFRKKIYDEFYIDKFDKNGKQKIFNQSLKNKTVEDFKEFNQLQKKSNDNLNLLRGKLFVEVRNNLRKNIDKNLFYIEAPTGAGKTNLSIMSAIEILQKDKTINKIFYVFPFTTLITQTYGAIKTVLNLNNSQIVQLHSKAKYNSKSESEKDGVYGDEKTNFLDNQFMNYPITLLSHVKFFDILTGVSKDDNYIFHRLANSIVIIDEIQTYNPDLWSQMVYLLDTFAKKFNIKFIVMSATLPKIGAIIDSNFTFLVSNKLEYFQNPNFKDRVEIDTKTVKIKEPKDIYKKVLKESKEYQKVSNSNKVKTIIEFITKKGADEFYQEAISKKDIFDAIFILSGTILEPRRKEIINFIKNNNDKNILLVTTQVVEAGVDIDMDIGLKEKSLADSDEQLAGRINRNSSKNNNKLFLFEMDNPKAQYVYKGDKRLGVDYENVFTTKDFDKYYNQVIEKLKKSNSLNFIENLNSYIDNIKNLRFSEAHIKIIDIESISVFVPINQMAKLYWDAYESVIKNNEMDFTNKKIKIKKLSSKMSNYTFSLAKYNGSGIEYLKNYCEEKYGYWYLKEEHIAKDDKFDESHIYTYNNGLDTRVLKGKNVGMFI